MSIVTIHEAKAQLSALIEQSLQGEEVIIARRDKPLVRLVPVDPRTQGGRTLGSAKGRFSIADDFDDTPEGFEDHEP